MDTAHLLEVAMLTCFGVSWPLGALRMLRSRRAEGRGLMPTALILAGYLAGLGAKVCVAELSLTPLSRLRGAPLRMKALPRFPGVGRDLSFFLDRGIAAEAVLGLVSRAAGPDLEGAEIFDVYEGKGVPAGKRSMAVALSFRKKERTLTDAEVDASQAAVIAALQTELQAEVRTSG